MPAVLLPCTHTIDVAHDRGERLVVCVFHETPIEHIVTAAHVDAVTYTARRRHPEPEEAAS